MAFFILIGITGETPTKIENQTVQKPVTENTRNTKIVEEDKDKNPESIAVEERQTDVIPTPTKKDTKTTPVVTPDPTPTPTSEPVQIEETKKQNVKPTSSETVSQKNAVRSAKAYLDYSAFSYGGLVDQLEYEQFSHADAIYGVDNCVVNWNEQAAKSAEAYMEYSAFSRGSLIKQLVYEKFTQSQAEYGADAVGL